MRGLILALLPSAAAAAFTHADRHAHHLTAAGLDRHGRTAGADSPKCVEGQHTAGCQGYPKDSPGIFFSGTFTDNAVLQREAKSAVYGVVVGATASTKVSVSMSGSADDGSVLAAAPIAATVDMSTSAAFGYARWKATLPEQKAGGNYSITAACAGKCGNQSSVTISDVGSPPRPIDSLPPRSKASLRTGHFWRRVVLFWPEQHVAGDALRHQPERYLRQNHAGQVQQHS